MDAIYTIGYERADPADFLATLEHAGVDRVLDVRAMPHSRRRGFSKKHLHQALGEAGIEYRNEPELGVPKPIRDQVKQDRDYDTFFRQYAALLDERDDLLHELAGSLDGRVALMCYERDFRICHRRLAAERLAAITGLQPHHLEVGTAA